MKLLPLLFVVGLAGSTSAQIQGSTREKNVHILSDSFEMPQLNRERRIWIYLPVSYQSSPNKKYPVLYLHDGQNLFDNATAYAGEWGIDETLNQLAAQGERESIVVGIDNGGDKRIEELSAFPNPEYGGGKGDAYMQFIVSTLKPYIDENYRTKTSKKHTTLGGSSLGALISVYGAVTYPEVFGNVLAFSSAFWFNQAALANYIKESDVKLSHQKYYFIEGTHETPEIGKNTREIIALLKSKKLKSKNLFYKSHEDGKHNEQYWRREFPKAYQWLN